MVLHLFLLKIKIESLINNV